MKESGQSKRDEELARLAREFARAQEQWAELQPKLAELAESGVRVNVSDEFLEQIESINTRTSMGDVPLHHFQRA